MASNHEILIEDPSIYDGWCVKGNTKTKELVWRDAYFTERLSDEFKQQWEENFRKNNEEFTLNTKDNE